MARELEDDSLRGETGLKSRETVRSREASSLPDGDQVMRVRSPKLHAFRLLGGASVPLGAVTVSIVDVDRSVSETLAFGLAALT